MATTAKRTSIYADVKATQSVTDVTLASYNDALEALFVIKDIDAWTPQIRSKTAIRSAKKHIFIDPSIGLAALGISPEYFNNDLDLFGHVLENMVLRDLLVYAENHNARVLHYTDDMGLEADAVYQMEDGRYALSCLSERLKAMHWDYISVNSINVTFPSFSANAVHSQVYPLFENK